MDCPKCSGKLAIKDHEGHIGYRCNLCLGVWLPQKFVNSLICIDKPVFDSFLADAEIHTPKITKFRCPQCQQKLVEHFSGDIAVDMCVSCRGIWFDKTELADWMKKQQTKLPKESKAPIVFEGLSIVFAMFFNS